jgi:TonB-linked SusC/RagA family outer membrane protein
VVGAITTLAPERLRSTTTRTLSNSLAGQVPGIIAVQRSGEPGYDASNFWIRGISTFQGGRNPLVLVDGIERSLNDISAVEVESFSVLKDAAASAVYGVRGANGVILINTKRGKIGKPTVNVTVETAMTQPTQLPEFVDGATYMEVMNSIAAESNMLPRYSAEQIENTRLQTDPDLYPDVNWMDAVTKDFATNTRVTFDVNGGTERLRYSLVASYYGEQGIMDRDKRQEWNSSLRLNRYNVRSNVDINITPTTLLRFNVGGYLQERTGTPESIDNIFNQAFTITPIVHPAQYSNGLFSRVVYRANPYVLATQRGFRRDNQSKIESLVSLEQDLKFVTPGLKVKGMFSFDNYSSNNVVRSKWPDMYNPAIGRDANGELMMGALDTEGNDYLGYEKGADWGNKSIYMELNASYSRTFAGKHAIDAMLMGNRRHYDDGDKQPYRNQGMAGRLSYTFDSRYIAEVNFGYNGSENFAKGKRYGFFPSVAAGWLLSEEAFMAKTKAVLSKVKLRASYGLAGNSTLDGRRFAYLSQNTGTDAYEFGYNKEWYVPGLWEGIIGVSDLTWETVYKTNVGFELGLWNAIDIQFDYFTEQRRDIFMQRKNIPADAGFSESPWANYGKVDNKGFEVSVTVNKQLNEDWFISAQANVTYAKNEILEQDEEAAKIGTYRSVVGRSVGQLEGLVAERLFTEDDFLDVANGILAPGVPTQAYVSRLRPGDIKYRDLNGDGVIDALDFTAIGGTEDPRLVYGFGVNVAYKGFDFGALLQGNGHAWRIIGRTQTFLPGGGNSAVGNIYTNVDDRWTVDNPAQDVFYPRLTLGSNENNSQASTWWLRDMSMLRVKNLEVGYSLPQALLKKIALSNMRIYLRGTNVLTFSEFKLWDPELNTGSNNGLNYPIMKSWSVGLEIGF